MSAKYAFIKAEKATRNADGRPRYQVKLMCAWMGVSTSGFYEWAGRGPSTNARWRAELGERIAAIFKAGDGTYGYRRIHAILRRQHRPCDPETVRSIMRERGLVACQPRTKRRCTTKPGSQVADIPDLVERDFTANAPGEKLVGDVTYVRTREGWLYVALVIDCYSRAILGWSAADHYRTSLVTAAVRMAARHMDLPENGIFHSDRGSNYTSDEYAGVLEGLGFRQSVGRTGDCYDNALAESTNGMLKVELVNRTEFDTRAEATTQIARWIELFYNQRRVHSGLGYQTPNEVMADYWDGQTAA